MKTVLVTGCSSGIGFASSKLFSQRGFRVLGCDFNPVKDLKLSEFYQLDLTNNDQRSHCLNAISSKYGGVDILVNVAGRFDLLSVEDTTLDILQAQIDLNLKVPFSLIQHFLPQMKTNKYGRIINISSQKGLKGASLHSAYCSTKHAIVGLTKAVGIEVAELGITCNAICPGWVLTPPLIAEFQQASKISGRSLEEESKQFLIDRKQPNTTMISPQDIAETIYFLTTDAASSITGQAISHDCGNTAD